MRDLACLLLFAACGTTTDDRPPTVEYVTDAILAPTCGAAQCHSSFSAQRTDVFDVVGDSTHAGVRTSLIGNNLINFDSDVFDPTHAERQQFIRWMTETDPLGLGIGRMPWDAPMPNEDIKFLIKWVSMGAPGSSCNPRNNQGLACFGKELHTCNPNWTFGAKQDVCSGDCVAGKCQ